jgi:peptidoglycan/LPS O-acetylase OafA/YrhL
MQRASISSTHIPAIDGLRALAVFAVVLYHLGIDWIPGGFLGVDLFFVISGYVITRLILDSIESANGLDLKEFYAARVRRLLPGLVILIIVTSVFIAFFAPDAIRRFITDVPFVLTGTNNWQLVAVNQDYFQAIGRPPLLQHTWSLAVEFQFYLIWPIILLFIWRRFGKRVVRRVALVIATFSGTAEGGVPPAGGGGTQTAGGAGGGGSVPGEGEDWSHPRGGWTHPRFGGQTRAT